MRALLVAITLVFPLLAGAASASQSAPPSASQPAPPSAVDPALPSAVDPAPALEDDEDEDGDWTKCDKACYICKVKQHWKYCYYCGLCRGQGG